MANQWQIKRLAGALGAEVSGTDLTTTTNSDIQDIKALLTEHKVLFFPGQNISPEQHVAFGHLKQCTQSLWRQTYQTGAKRTG